MVKVCAENGAGYATLKLGESSTKDHWGYSKSYHLEYPETPWETLGKTVADVPLDEQSIPKYI
jgi:hypothetical protein